MDSSASAWADFYTGANQAYNDIPETTLLKFLPDVPKGCALDVGAGLGQNSLFLARQGFSVEALEKDPGIALKCREILDAANLNIKTIANSIEAQELEESKYTLIVAAWVFQYVSPEQVRPVLKKLVRALVPGGFLYIGTFSTADAGFAGAKEFLDGSRNTVKHKSGLVMHYFEQGELEKELAALEDVISVSGTRRDYSHGEPHTHGLIELVRRKAPVENVL